MLYGRGIEVVVDEGQCVCYYHDGGKYYKNEFDCFHFLGFIYVKGLRPIKW